MIYISTQQFLFYDFTFYMIVWFNYITDWLAECLFSEDHPTLLKRKRKQTEDYKMQLKDS